MSWKKLVLACALVSVSAGQASSQSPDDPMTALLLLPEIQRADASIYAFNEHLELTAIRDENGSMFCISDTKGDDRFSVECHPVSMFGYIARRKKITSEEDIQDRDRILQREIDAGMIELPVGALSYFASGRIEEGNTVPEQMTAWEEFDLPFATPAETGIVTTRTGLAPYIMSAGTLGAHVMLNQRSITWQEFVGTEDT